MQYLIEYIFFENECNFVILHRFTEMYSIFLLSGITVCTTLLPVTHIFEPLRLISSDPCCRTLTTYFQRPMLSNPIATSRVHV